MIIYTFLENMVNQTKLPAAINSAIQAATRGWNFYSQLIKYPSLMDLVSRIKLKGMLVMWQFEILLYWV